MLARESSADGRIPKKIVEGVLGYKTEEKVEFEGAGIPGAAVDGGGLKGAR